MPNSTLDTRHIRRHRGERAEVAGIALDGRLDHRDDDRHDAAAQQERQLRAGQAARALGVVDDGSGRVGRDHALTSRTRRRSTSWHEPRPEDAAVDPHEHGDPPA